MSEHIYPGDYDSCWICFCKPTVYQDVIGMWWCKTHYEQEYGPQRG